MANKSALADVLRGSTGVQVDPHALFDVHIKRIHEYKRQLLNILETIALYQEIRAQPDGDLVPRVKIFAGKAAASYDARQTDHQARQRRRARRQRRSRRRRPAEAGVRAELQRQPRRSDHPGRRSVRADFDRRHGSLRHRQHEARAQRRHHHRHARRRQYRNPRAGRRATTSSSSGMTADEVAERQAERDSKASTAVRSSPRLAGVVRRLAAGDFSPDDPERFRADRASRCSTTTASWSRPISTPTGTRSARVDRLWQDAAALVARQHPQHRAHGLVLVRPRHPRIRARHLERAGAQSSVDAASGLRERLATRASDRACAVQSPRSATGSLRRQFGCCRRCPAC